MASREKRPLAPSKSKQKASNDSGLPSPQNNRKRAQSTVRQQHIARDFLDVVASGSQLSPKLDATLPRKNVLRLRRKQKLRNAKANLIKVKVTKKVPIKNLPFKKKGLKLKKVKRLVEADRNASSKAAVEQRADDTENEVSGKSSKNNLRTKKKSAPRGAEETETVPSAEPKDTSDAVGVANPKNSPKTTRKLKPVEIPDSPARSAKTSKTTINAVTKRNASKERESSVTKQTRSGIVGKETENPVNVKSTSISPESKNPKKIGNPVNTSVDLTIEEVVASMLSDTEHEDCQVIGGKITRSRKMLIDGKLFTEVEIKKEIIEAEEERRSASEDDSAAEILQESHNSIQLRNRSGNSFTQRSLRNGKLRQLSDSGIAADLELKKRRWPNMDESNATESGAEMSVDNVSDTNTEAEYSFSESSGTENASNVASTKDETSPTKSESPSEFDQANESGMELENNNNSERMDRTAGEVGPILRSKTKAKSTEMEIKIEDGDTEEPRPLGRSLAGQLEPRKSGSLDQLRKESLPKIVDKSPKSRRSSLNIDVKKTINSFYAAEKTENASKSHIDLMIETIKLGIAKSIESKISRSEKSLVLNKNFEIPKIEEIVAPLSAESQKLGLEEITEEDKPNASKNEGASNSSENSVPKVADTAKEIEKLVMGDSELVDTQNSESANVEVSRDDQQVFEQQQQQQQPVDSSQNNEKNISRTSENSPKKSDDNLKKADNVTADKADETETASDQKDPKKPIITRKSLRNKNSNESVADLDHNGKSTGSAEDAEQSSKDEARESTSSSVEASEEKCNDEESATTAISASSETEVDAKSTTVEKNAAEPNVSLISDDSETLDSISKEVERLVGEASTTNSVEVEPSGSSSDKQQISNTTSQKSTETIVNKESSEPEKTEPLETMPTNESNFLLQDSVEKLTATITTNTVTDEQEETVESTTVTHKTQSSKNNQVKNSESLQKSLDKENPDRTEEIVVESQIESGKTRSDKNTEEQKSAAEENRRVLRARDKLRKAETKSVVRSTDPAETTIKVEVEVHNELEETAQDAPMEEQTTEVKPNKPENCEVAQITIKIEEAEPPMRPRRSREVKRRKEELTSQSQNTLKNKRSRREVRKSDQQNKEETLLDDEVATINENNRSLADKYGKSLGSSDSLRGFSEGGRGPIDKLQNSSESNRSKSENDIENVKSKSECSGRLSDDRAESGLKEAENADGRSDSECKIPKTPEISQKDSDDASTSGESSSSSTLNSIIHETAEDKAEKEKILRLLGLESLEKAAQRLNHQKAKKEQYTGTLKTVIRVQKNKEKKRSRSPLKMVLKQGRGDGEGDSPEFYTIQKEFGTSGVGDSSSDENNEEATPKDRQSLVIPEKSSSFSIHPGRCCADVCCHCGGKFGSLDTPMHLAQMKSDERRQKILTMQKLLNEDSCICDACYRCVDRKANTSPTNMQTKPHRQLMVLKCSARECREPARHSVKRRWLQRIKARLHNQVDINWESSQHTSMPFCVHHYSKIERFLTCALCTRRLAKNHTHRLAPTETEELNERLRRQGIPVHLVGGTFVCKLCRYFTQLQLKYKFVQNMNASSRSFFKDYRIRMLKRYDIEVFDCEEDDALPSTSREESLPGTSKDKDKRNKKVKCTPNKGAGTSKSPDVMITNSTSDKLTIEPIPKNSEGANSETDNENRVTKLTTVQNEEAISREVQLMDLESTVEKLKKRKALEQHIYPSETSITCETRGSDVVEILAMDKEVTLTRLPKRPRVASDITPVVQRLGANPSISVRTLFPGEEEMNLHANVEFANVREITPQGWEKCATMIQYDRDTKVLWQELQRPYGNQSSFLRHLILLEKYYRSGDLVLAPNASRNAINYSTSVQNRLISYEGPEKMDEPIMEPISAEYSSSRRLSGGYMMERDRLSLPSTSSLLNSAATKSTSGGSSSSSATTNTTTTTTTSVSNAAAAAVAQQTAKSSPPRILKLTSGVSIIKKPPPSLQRLSLPSGSSTNGGAAKRKETGYPNKIPVTSGGKVFQLSENEYKRLQNLKKQKQLLSEQQKQQQHSSSSLGSGSGSSNSAGANATAKSNTLASQYQKAQIAAQTQFQKHLRMQQEMLNRQSRGDFEPLICDVRSLTNENTPTQNLLNNLNLPKSIQVTTKPPNPIPILPKIPKSLTVIPQTVSRPLDK